MDYGIKISKQGFDVELAADKDLLLKSSINMFKIAAQGQTTVGSGATISIAHGLGYKPNFFGFIERSASTNEMRLLTCFAAFNLAYAWVDNTNLKIKNLTTGTRKVFYYILHDPI